MSSPLACLGSQLPGGPHPGGRVTAMPTNQSQLHLNIVAVHRLMESVSYETRGGIEGMFVERREWEMLAQWVKEAAKHISTIPTKPETTQKDIEDIKKNVAQLYKVLAGPAWA